MAFKMLFPKVGTHGNKAGNSWHKARFFSPYPRKGLKTKKRGP